MYINLVVLAIVTHFSGRQPPWDLWLPWIGLAKAYQKFAAPTLPL